MKIFDKGNKVIQEIEVDDTSVRYRSIMTDDSLTLNFSLTGAITVPQFSYVIFEGQRYTLWRAQEFKKINTRNHEYTLVMHAWREYLKFVKFKDTSAKPYRLKFSLTAKPAFFLKQIVDCLNLKDSGWTVGDCIDSPEKTLSFNHEYCIDVLGRVSQEWNTEYEFEGKKLHLRKVEKFKDAPLALSYGKGNGFLPGVGRYNDGDKQPIGRLYVQGGERNIDFSIYGSKTLLLPKSATLVYAGKTFRTDADGMYITREGNANEAEDSYDAASIYPRRIGTVSGVIVVDAAKHLYDVKDVSIPEVLNYRDCRIAGEKAIIKFESGALAGREFDIEQSDNDLSGYIHQERKFKIVPAELDGVIMPGGAFVPSVGDKYAIFNINLPQAYIADNATRSGASWDMFREAVRYFADNEADRFRFTGELDGIWSKSRWMDIGGKIVPGGHVLFSDEQFQPQGVVIRIMAVKDYVNKPHKPEITLSNAPISGSFSSGLAKLEADEVVIEKSKNEVLQFSKRQWRDARETMAMLEKSMLNFGSGINPITVRTMQLIAGDESLQFRFVTSKTAPVAVQHSVTFNKVNKTLNAGAGILQHMTLEIKTLSNAHKPTEYRYWDVATYTSPPLTAEKPYYLYARCAKAGTAGTFVLSETPISMEAVSGQYHLLVGILNSETEGDRSFAPLYGFTEILPGRITADKIISHDGKTYFDLLGGIIAGRIKFASTAGDTDLSDWTKEAEKGIQDAKDKVDNLEIGGRNLIKNRHTINILGADSPELTSVTDTINSKGEKEITVTSLTADNNGRAYRYTWIHMFLSSPVKKGENVFSFDYKTNHDGGMVQLDFRPPSVTFGKTLENTNGEWRRGHFLCDWKNATTQESNLLLVRAANNVAGNYTSVRNFKLVEGNKGWEDSEAPEDIQKRIDEAKQAAANAQTAANSANSAVGNLNTYVDGAFKDGVIDAGEAKAIEKYINVINSEKAGLEATYNKLYANGYLEGAPKASLLNAKVTYFGKVDALLAAINTAIADGKTTVAEKQAVDARYNDYKTALAALQSAIEEANKAIQAKLDAISKGYVEGLEIGGRNIIRSSTNFDSNFLNHIVSGESRVETFELVAGNPIKTLFVQLNGSRGGGFSHKRIKAEHDLHICLSGYTEVVRRNTTSFRRRKAEHDLRQDNKYRTR